MASWEEPPLPRSFDSVFYGAAGGGEDLPSDDQFNRVSFLSHFDGANNGVNNVFDDGSASNHTITAAGNVTQGSFGPFARPDGEFGVSFTGNYLTINEGATGGSGNWTIEMFIFPANVSSGEFGSIFDNRPDSTNGLYQTLALAAGTLKFYVGGTGASYRITSDDSLSANTWYHVALCKSGSSTKMFIDGTQTGSTFTDNVTYINTGRTLIAGEVTFGSGIDDFFKGQISNLRIVNSALYTGNFTAPTGKLTAVTNTALLTCQSNRFVDNSGNGHTVTPSGGAAISAFGPFLTSSVYDPAVNGASLYNGVDADGNYVSAADSADWDFGSGNYTVECWAYATAQGSFNKLVGQWAYNGANAANSWVLETVGTDVEAYAKIGGSAVLIAQGAALVINQWNHVALVRNGNNHNIYINGVAGATTSNSSAYETGNGSLEVGSFSQLSGGSWDGYITDVRVVKGTAVYTSNFTPPTAPLTAITNTKLLLNMADGQAIDSAAQAEWTATNVYDGTPKLQTAQKKIGTSSLYFDGSSSYYFPSGFLPDGTGDYTIEFWFRTSNLNDNATIFVAGNIYFQLYQNNLYYWNGASSRIISGTISTDTWYHVAGVRSGTTIYLFLNGTSQGTTLTGITGAVVGGAGYMGGNTGSYKYTGYIDEMRISRFARYTSSFTPATEPFADKGR